MEASYAMGRCGIRVLVRVSRSSGMLHPPPPKYSALDSQMDLVPNPRPKFKTSPVPRLLSRR
ncbi:hypothetical protein B0H17DRAFT_601541 [Mycena rosella]|uniref:Uncharacterized protein n=1 Tax=Mycena rosella TaxID=1033263 RepID=A0AAD7BHB4_MYCRO|nr:hypothetical protein B0H17DRAFT_601541 [Mycena rosella]